MKWKCTNPECEQNGKFVITGKSSFVFRNGQLVPRIIEKCPYCKKEMTYIEERNTEMPDFKIGEFAGMTNTQKSEVLKKRAQAYNKKDDARDKKEYYRNKAIKSFYGE